MKTRISFMLALMLGLFVFNCGPNSDDNDESTLEQSNQLVINDDSIELKVGIVENWGIYDTGIYNFDLYLVDSEVSIVDGEYVPENNTFSFVYFELFTSNPNSLDDGTYTVTNNITINSIGYTDLALNVDLETGEELVEEINSATLTVLDNGTNYEFQFEGTTYAGAEFSGYYKGSLITIDYSEENGRMASGTTKTKGFSIRK